MLPDFLKIQTINFVVALHVLLPALLFSQEAGMEQNRHVIAVLKFKNNTDVFAYDRLETNIPEMLKTELSQYPQLVIVERENIESIMSEQVLSLSGVMDDSSTQEVGRLLGAEYMLTGEISLVNTSQLRIDCHITSVATGQVKGEKIVGHRDKSLEKMVQILARNIYYNLTGSGDYQVSARVRNYPTVWFLAGTALTALAGGFAHLGSDRAYDSYQNTTSLDDFDRYYDRANNLRKVRNGFWIASAALAITTAILWQTERSDDNKIYAHSGNYIQPKTLWAVNFDKGMQLGLLVNF